MDRALHDRYFQAALVKHSGRFAAVPARRPLRAPLPPLLAQESCLVVALRQLLDDPHWGPAWVVDEIAMYAGFPHDRLGEIPGVRPLVGGWITVCLEAGPAMVSVNTGECVFLDWDERIIALTYDQALGEGHAECMTVRELWRLPGALLGIICGV